MDAFINATVAVAIAEIGDKTQLLSILLVARFAKPLLICAGVLVATVVNHGLSAWLGAELTHWIPNTWLPWIIGCSFLAVAVWTLIPDKVDENDQRFSKLGAFGATCIVFFLAEMGDKTQVATVLLAAHYSQALMAVILGTTLGMLIANIPAIYGGAWLLQKFPIQWFHRAAFVIFLIFALISFYHGTMAVLSASPA
ncbi:TMEM165/GDT1 family protein [Gilvimarinus agarilyticus]|uniref:TMEM165/GDT1 family protein n=1 Tax=unclassified Gilvimarinus TaxID=2642066 RepID=UPI001C089042|nr:MULTISPECIES: TMEM165/GDT1 family protein [unclassified Gilvimarinus]MBU2886990.1 TMEM165/GDT1 family protein [Gilvimarinus agarilyticus]MDO6571650.1 TMEM165/GDT1 family protein [Gilvimarinus sp. 2_MG-2023]MDO6745722.1 TMEM165/GDT1 family protein [Gilvimarinus sp. 1_MG-2023]